ncbi:MAG: transferrin-binding protein-like solute binding protein [Paracoccaceae bacterium]
MRFLTVLLISAFTLTACGNSTSPTPPTPYVASPIADLTAGTEMQVRGNHTGWWRADIQNPSSGDGENRANGIGPKLQKIITTDTVGEYRIVFRRNAIFNNGIEVHAKKEYGDATFTMPANGDVVAGVTSLNYKYTITRNNDNLVYTLTGLFSISTKPISTANPNPGRFAYGGYVAGSYTPAGDVPTAGSATYNGDFIGQSSVPAAGTVTGTAQVNVNFAAATNQVSGSITNISGGGLSLNDLSISATITPADGSYTGIITAGAQPAGDAGMPVGTQGKIDGGFYGPNAEETGATIYIKNGTHHLTGAIGGSQ